MSRTYDWRDSAFVDRERAVDEIHLRASYPLRPYARISHMIRVMRSPSDLFREELYKRYWQARRRRKGKFDDGRSQPFPEEWLTPAVDIEGRAPDEISAAISRRRRASQERQDVAKDAMRALRTLPSETNVVLKAFARGDSIPSAQAKVLAEFKTCMKAIGSSKRYAESLAGQTRAAVSEMAKLVDLYRPGQPLEPETSALDRVHDDDESDGREPFKRLHPFVPGGAPALDQRHFTGRRLWLNLWKPEGPDTPEDAQTDRLRAAWELYDANQNFSFFQDFDDASEAAAHKFFDGASSQGVVNTQDTASRSAVRAIERLTENSPFDWRGELFALSHFFVIPLRDVLGARLALDETQAIMEDLERARGPAGRIPAAVDQKVRDIISEEARRYFRFPDKTRANGVREDFILTMVYGGAAILVSDLRPHSRTAYHLERAARTLIFDISLNNEERGRLLKICTDLATYRMLGVRSYANFFPATEVFKDVSEELSERTFRIGKTKLRFRIGKSRLRAKLDQIAALSERIAATNFFITDGVNGAAGQAANYARLAEDRLALLNEMPFAGYQSAREVFARFLSSSLNVRRFAERYEQVRRRIAEANDLLRAELDYNVQSGIQRLTLVAAIVGGIAAGAALIAALNPDHTKPEPVSSSVTVDTKTPAG